MTDRPRILYITHSYDNRAGVEEHLKLLAGMLKDRYEAFILYPTGTVLRLRYPTGEYLQLEADAVPLLAPYWAPRTARVVEKLLELVRPDLVHLVHFLNWPLCLLDQLNVRGLPVLMSFHDYYAVTPYYTMQGAESSLGALSPEYSKRVFGRDLGDYLEMRQRVIARTMQRARFLVVPSAYLQAELGRVFPFPFRVIPYGIRPFSARRREASPGAIRFGYLGSLLPQKGWHVLLEAFSEVQKRSPAAELHFFGGATPGVKAPGVFFRGAYEQHRLPQVLAEIDVGVIPSLFAETYSLVLSEMWQAGVVPVVSDIGALRERVEEGVNGRKAPPGDAKALAEKLRWFATDSSWRSWSLPTPVLGEEMTGCYAGLYREMLSSG